MNSPNKVQLRSDGVISIAVVGDQTKELVDALVADILPLVDKLKQEGRPVYLLSDSSLAGRHSPISVWRRGILALSHEHYDKVAVFGANTFLTGIGKWVAKSLGQEQKMRYFQTQDQAEGWLRA